MAAPEEQELDARLALARLARIQKLKDPRGERSLRWSLWVAFVGVGILLLGRFESERELLHTALLVLIMSVIGFLELLHDRLNKLIQLLIEEKVIKG